MLNNRRSRRTPPSEHIEPHANDVLNGRGVKIAQHEGNLRFRALVKQFIDETYCATFSSCEKKALACRIIDHIQKLSPPGRFLKKHGNDGPWVKLTRQEVEKKTKQALRDCNRADREGYAKQVQAPQDVEKAGRERENTGMSLQEFARRQVSEQSRKRRPRNANKNQKLSPVPSTASRPSRQTRQVEPTPSRSNGSIPGVHNDTLETAVPAEVPYQQMAAAAAPVSTWTAPAAVPSSVNRTPAARPHPGPTPVTQTPNHPNYSYSSANNSGHYQVHHGSQQRTNAHSAAPYVDHYSNGGSMPYYLPPVTQSINSVARTGSPIDHSPIVSSAGNNTNVADEQNETFAADEYTAHPRQNLFGDEFPIHPRDEFDSMAANAASSLNHGAGVDDLLTGALLGFEEMSSHQQVRK
eukprot:CAMPEP_0116147164 /NCGR_PEP_ID=MMETSP0329-20121206/17600_1 /TAXON_ID=697910 /ORGANISM="Pseudo-nitzschia arenysensis, Strain B593" /LENGTH=409 /DNA_ID=CAMNT_0003643057 /DNA_START=532 /DNA_END=1761 /DNA_ORIENTATION=-